MVSWDAEEGPVERGLVWHGPSGPICFAGFKCGCYILSMTAFRLWWQSWIIVTRVFVIWSFAKRNLPNPDLEGCVFLVSAINFGFLSSHLYDDGLGPSDSWDSFLNAKVYSLTTLWLCSSGYWIHNVMPTKSLLSPVKLMSPHKVKVLSHLRGLQSPGPRWRRARVKNGLFVHAHYHQKSISLGHCVYLSTLTAAQGAREDSSATYIIHTVVRNSSWPWRVMKVRDEMLGMEYRRES